MELLPRYSLSEAAYHLGMTQDEIMKFIFDGSLSVAIDISSFAFGFIHVATRRRIHVDDWVHDFEDVIDENDTAYAYILLTGLERYVNLTNKKFKLAENTYLGDVKTFCKYPSGHEYGFTYEYFYENQLSVQVDIDRSAYSFPIYITREALLNSKVTKHIPLSHLDDFSQRELSAAERFIKALRDILGEKHNTQTSGYSQIIRNLLIRVYHHQDLIPKAPAIKKMLEIRANCYMDEKTIRNILAHCSPSKK